MTHQQVRMGVTVAALCFAILGAMLLFAPEVVGGAALGGIYGRAVVAGSQTHLAIGALVLVKRGIDGGAVHPAPWLVTGLCVLGAPFFVYLTFFSSGLREQRPGGSLGAA